jgi:RimJ/RimL family protein N-acetyltransferase
VLSDIELLDLEIDALFRFDAAGRIVGSNEQDPQPAPRLYLGSTRQGHRRRFGRDVPDELAAELEQLLRRTPAVADLTEAALPLQSLRELLRTSDELPAYSSGPAFRFPDAIPQAPAATLITPDNAGVLLPHFPWTATELPYRLPCAAVVVDGVAVSICFSSRNTDRAAEAGVDTIEAYRRRGYATAVTARWAQAVCTSGRIPFYSTWWDNHASRGVARSLGLIQFAVELSIV